MSPNYQEKNSSTHPTTGDANGPERCGANPKLPDPASPKVIVPRSRLSQPAASIQYPNDVHENQHQRDNAKSQSMMKTTIKEMNL